MELIGERVNVWPDSIQSDLKGANDYGEDAARF
jgi:hypothetical protein